MTDKYRIPGISLPEVEVAGDLDGTELVLVLENCKLKLKEARTVAQTVLTTTASGNTVLVGADGVIPLNVGGQTLAVLGDSISNQNTAGDDFSEKGYAVWAMILSSGALSFKPELNFGVSGDKAADALLRVDSVIAAAPTFCAVHIGTNDIGQGAGDAVTSYASMIASIEAIYVALLNAGIAVIAIPILPKSDASQSVTKQKQLNRVNNWIRRYSLASNKQIILADPFESLVDYTLTTGVPIGGHAGGTTAVTTDGVHPSKRGAWLMGKTIVDALGSRITPVKFLQHSPTDLYDATYNPTGNLLANGLFSGTAGTNGTGSSGSVADNWTASRQGGTTGTIVASKTTKTLTNGQTIPQQTLVITAPAGSAPETLAITSAQVSTGFTAGVDTVYGEIEVSISGITADSFIGVEYTLGDGTITSVCLLKATNGYMPNLSWDGVLRTPEFVVTAGATSIYARFRIYVDGTVASAGVTAQIGRATIRKVSA